MRLALPNHSDIAAKKLHRAPSILQKTIDMFATVGRPKVIQTRPDRGVVVVIEASQPSVLVPSANQPFLIRATNTASSEVRTSEANPTNHPTSLFVVGRAVFALP